MAKQVQNQPSTRRSKGKSRTGRSAKQVKESRVDAASPIPRSLLDPDCLASAEGKGQKHLATLIRAHLQDAGGGGDLVAARLLGIVRRVESADKDVIQAAKLLWEYGYGRAPIEVKLGVEAYTDAQLVDVARSAMAVIDATQPLGATVPLLEGYTADDAPRPTAAVPASGGRVRGSDLPGGGAQGSPSGAGSLDGQSQRPGQPAAAAGRPDGEGQRESAAGSSGSAGQGKPPEARRRPPRRRK